mmetsp:Transcript_95440/g.253607  ORF Transcript_95440/g.253607 Transcript_95440/m.253607 type:complete len:293 (+) Transcript_95440:2-880(+)
MDARAARAARGPLGDQMGQPARERQRRASFREALSPGGVGWKPTPTWRAAIAPPRPGSTGCGPPGPRKRQACRASTPSWPRWPVAIRSVRAVALAAAATLVRAVAAWRWRRSRSRRRGVSRVAVHPVGVARRVHAAVGSHRRHAAPARVAAWAATVAPVAAAAAATLLRLGRDSQGVAATSVSVAVPVRTAVAAPVAVAVPVSVSVSVPASVAPSVAKALAVAPTAALAPPLGAGGRRRHLVSGRGPLHLDPLVLNPVVLVLRHDHVHGRGRLIGDEPKTTGVARLAVLHDD